MTFPPGSLRGRLEDLLLDLEVERRKLAQLLESLHDLQMALERDPPTSERVDAGALRLQSLYTGVERCLVQIVRALNGGTPEGSDWHRRLLERMTVSTDLRPAVLRRSTADDLGELLRFRHVVRHLYAYELEPAAVQRLMGNAITLWPAVSDDFDAFAEWVRQLLITL